MTNDRGVVFVAIGDKAQREAHESLYTLNKWNDFPVKVIDQITGNWNSRVSASRWAKLNLFELAPYQSILYLDADTRVRGDVSGGFDMLDDGWDMAMSFSTQQGHDLFWHVGDQEVDLTLREIGRTPLQMQAGVMFVNRNDRTLKLFEVWRLEWSRWRDQDQAAFIRALDIAPVKLWLLGRPWNGGALIAHLCGRCRE